MVAVFAFVVGACSDDDVDSGESTEQDDTIEALNDEVDEQTQRADDAEEALIEIAQQFPVTVTASLEEFDLKGAYTMSLTEAYCDGLSTCGAGRPDIRVDIVDGANGNDRIDGGAGNDEISSGSGSDRVVAGKGRDLVEAGSGNDTIDARDGERDVIRCGSGRDTVKADARDRLSGCERVNGRSRR